MRLRPATPDDVEAITALIARSVHGLQAGDYTADQREAALGSVFGVDHQLLADRTYLLAWEDRAPEGEALAGCGGWSFRRTLFGARSADAPPGEPLDPAAEPARIRAFFVDPAFARRGVGAALLDACEAGARAAGFTRIVLGATLTGVAFYAARGYRATEQEDAPLPGGGSLAIVHMAKDIASDERLV